jgi:hypothetical protein
LPPQAPSTRSQGGGSPKEGRPAARERRQPRRAVKNLLTWLPIRERATQSTPPGTKNSGTARRRKTASSQSSLTIWLPLLSTSSTSSAGGGSPEEGLREARERGASTQRMQVERTHTARLPRGGSLDGGWTPHKNKAIQGKESRTRQPSFGGTAKQKQRTKRRHMRVELAGVAE